jgi:glycosyltransferase involved in cell wall biosynthesis
MTDSSSSICISIVMPNMNGEKYIERAIASFIDQEYENKELIIVDGNSTDASHEIIKEFADRYDNITWINKPDRTLPEGINNGLAHVKGDMVGYLGSDDLLYKGTLAEVAYNCRWSQCDAIFFNSYTFHIKERRSNLHKPVKTDFSKKNLLRYGTLVGLQNIFFARHVYEKYQFDPLNKWSCDYELYLRISGESYFYLYCDRVATINIFDDNMSSDPDGKQFKESCEVAEAYNDSNEKLYFSATKYKRRRLKRRLKNIFSRPARRGN